MIQTLSPCMSLPVLYAGLSDVERIRVRLEYVRKQQGKCFHCGGSLRRIPPKEVRVLPIDKKLFPPGFFYSPVHLHHSHVTGMTIGAVHSYCNAVLWQHKGE